MARYLSRVTGWPPSFTKGEGKERNTHLSVKLQDYGDSSKLMQLKKKNGFPTLALW